MSILEMIPIQLLLAFALAQTCAIQLCPHALAPRAVTCTSALHIQLEYTLARGSEIQMRSSVPSSSFHLWLVGSLTGIIDLWAVVQMLAWKTLLLRCWYKASLVGGILSTSLVFCENILNRTRSTSLSSFDSLEYSLQTKFVATSISLGDIWNGVSTILAHSSIRDDTSCINLQQYPLPLTWRKTYCLILWMRERGPWLCMWSYQGLWR